MTHLEEVPQSSKAEEKIIMVSSCAWGLYILPPSKTEQPSNTGAH